jgi:hypothetical protein
MANVPSMDVEMLTLRRSERIAKLQQSKEFNVVNKTKKEPKKVNDANQTKPKRAIKKKQSTKTCKDKCKKAIDCLREAEDLSKVKINHLFTLIKKYCPSEERTVKYSILQTILKTYKKIGIKNTLQDLTSNVQKVARYLSSDYDMVVVQDTLTSLLSFPELMLLSTQNQTSQLSQGGLDELIGMMANTNITSMNTTIDDDLTALFAGCHIG